MLAVVICFCFCTVIFKNSFFYLLLNREVEFHLLTPSIPTSHTGNSQDWAGCRSGPEPPAGPPVWTAEIRDVGCEQEHRPDRGVWVFQLLSSSRGGILCPTLVSAGTPNSAQPCRPFAVLMTMFGFCKFDLFERQSGERRNIDPLLTGPPPDAHNS